MYLAATRPGRVVYTHPLAARQGVHDPYPQCRDGFRSQFLPHSMMILNLVSHQGHGPSFPDGIGSESKSTLRIGAPESAQPPLLCCRRCGYYSNSAEARSVCGGDAAAIIFYFLAAPIERRERGRGMGEKGRDEKQTGKILSVMDLNANAKRNRNRSYRAEEGKGRGNFRPS